MINTSKQIQNEDFRKLSFSIDEKRKSLKQIVREILLSALTTLVFIFITAEST